MIDFISTDPVGQGFDAEWARRERVRKAQEEAGVDAAVRRGLGGILSDPRWQPQRPAPVAPPSDASYAPLNPAPAPGSRKVNLSPDIQGVVDTFATKHGVPLEVARAMAMQESSGNPTVNPGGLFQITEGTARDPGFGVQPMDPSDRILTHKNADFAMNYLASRARAAGLDLNKPEDRVTALRLYNAGGDPRYAENVLRFMGAGTPAAAPSSAPAPGGWGGDFAGTLLGGGAPQQGQGWQPNQQYRPLLQELQNTPGGGKVALDLLGRSDKFDTSQQKRQDNYQKLALQALGRGDVTSARYYAEISGLALPEEAYRNAGAGKRLAAGGLLASRIYGQDKAKGALFLRTYLQTGDAGRAFDTAGPPVDQPNFQKIWVLEGEREVLYGFDSRTNTIAPVAAAPTQGGQGAPSPQGAPDFNAVGNTQSGYAPLPSAPSPAGGAAPSGGLITRPPQGSAKKSSVEVKYDMLRKAGLPESDARMAAAGYKPPGIKPEKLAEIYRGLVAALMDPTEADREMVGMFGPDWRDQVRNASSGAQPAPRPEAPRPRLPAAPVDQGAATPNSTPPAPQQLRGRQLQWNAARRLWRDKKTGEVFDEQGKPVGGG